jgi:hypothetical protein
MDGTYVSPTLRVDFVAVVLSLGVLLAAMVVLDRARTRGETRRPLARAIARDAGPRDFFMVADEAPELLALARPVAGVWGVPPMGDLKGVRRVYAMATTASGLAPFFVRFGPGEPFANDVRVRRWNIEALKLSHQVFNASDVIGTALQGHREGGAAEGPCTPEPGRLACAGDPWNAIVFEPHHFDGIELSCIYAHPHEGGRVVLELTGLPPADALVGVVGIDDAGFHAGAASVTFHIEYHPEGLPAIIHEEIAPNRKGLIAWRVAVPHKPATATISVSAPNAGARQFCFTFASTELVTAT